jgi:hypothetical protein
MFNHGKSFWGAQRAWDSMEPPCPWEDDEHEECLASEEDLKTERQIEAWEDER